MSRPRVGMPAAPPLDRPKEPKPGPDMICAECTDPQAERRHVSACDSTEDEETKPGAEAKNGKRKSLALDLMELARLVMACHLACKLGISSIGAPSCILSLMMHVIRVVRAPCFGSAWRIGSHSMWVVETLFTVVGSMVFGFSRGRLEKAWRSI
eukprot:g2510.t1